MPDLAVDVMPSLTAGSTSRGPSASIWKTCPWLELPPYGFLNDGITEYDDFMTASAALTNAALSKYKVVGTTGTAILLGTDDGGVIQMATSTSANNESMLAYGQTTGGMQQIINATPNAMWFEARCRVQSIANSGYFIGLAKPTDIASGFLVNATHVVASTVNAIGFCANNTTPTKLDIVYAKGAAPTVFKTGALTLAANTWFKVGMRYYGNKMSPANNVEFFVNGLRIGNTANTATGVAANATNVPSSVMLTGLFAAKTSDTTNVKLEVDWWRYAGIIQDTTYG